jgi:ribonucleoside-diphosphate reductase alpha chain
MMDCDTTGIEPDLGLVKVKKLVGGGTMSIVNQTVPRALKNLGYAKPEIDDIVAYIDEEKTILGAPHLKGEHEAVFACSMGDNAIHYRGHVKMMAAVQPFLSGAISKTVNMPEEATVEDIEQIHIEAWKMGLKAVAIYRDNCKVAQPLSMAKKAGSENAPVPAATPVAATEAVNDRYVLKGTVRREMPRERNAKTIAFHVAGSKGYVTVGEFEDGTPGEVFMKIAKQGSTLAGVMDSLAVSVSYGLQYGVPLKSYVHGLTNMSFAPSGITDDPDIRTASSLVDYIFRRLALTYLSFDDLLELGMASIDDMPDTQTSLLGDGELLAKEPASIAAVSVTPAAVQPALATTTPAAAHAIDPTHEPLPTLSSSEPAANATTHTKAVKRDDTAPICYNCGNQTQRAGSCYVCGSCGSTTGCS